MLEIASGTCQHIVHFGAALPQLAWQPSDPDPEMRASIAAWIAETGLPNVRQPLAIDVRDEQWPVEHADAVVAVNMVHIAPWTATLGIIRGAGRLLPASGALILYGPYKRGASHTAPSNEAFDAQLRSSNAEWGIRDLEAVVDAARFQGLELEEVVEMPANNLTVVFRRFISTWAVREDGLARASALAPSRNHSASRVTPVASMPFNPGA